MALLLVLVALTASWTSAALWFQFGPPHAVPAMIGVVVLALGILLVARSRPGAAWGGLAAGLLAVGLWWGSILPSNDRDWAPDVAHGVTGEVRGAELILHNVRNFEWRSEDTFTPRWETRRYRLDQLRSVDLFSSVWDSPAIAHTLVSFGFSDGRHLVFSAEIRRERHESFSAIGGFFKQFELVMIAAEENDIIRLRTDFRRESVSLFPLRVGPEQARELLLSFVERANELDQTPEFYQTATTNCTTVIFQLARLVAPGIPLDWRVLLSGYLPDYLYQHGMIVTDLPLDEVRRRALIAPQDQPQTAPAEFSAAIRNGASSGSSPPPP